MAAKPADLLKHWDPDYEPTQAELEGPITPPEDVESQELLRRLFDHKPNPAHVEYWGEHGGDNIL